MQPRQARPTGHGVELVGVAERRRRVEQALARVLAEAARVCLRSAVLLNSAGQR
jgi:hypothetical protein